MRFLPLGHYNKTENRNNLFPITESVNQICGYPLGLQHSADMLQRKL
jgi:hypothetical protein